MPQRTSLQHSFHALEDNNHGTDDCTNAPRYDVPQFRTRCALGSLLERTLLQDGLLDGEGEGEREASELDGEVRAPAEIKIGELPESVLDLEQSSELVVEGEYARSACYSSPR